jgi:ribosome-associated toxin RatA of RatAB toxin-antitoxin module
MNIDEKHLDSTLFCFFKNVQKRTNTRTVDVCNILKIKNNFCVGTFKYLIEVQFQFIGVKQVNFFLKFHQQHTIFGFEFDFHWLLLL